MGDSFPTDGGLPVFHSTNADIPLETGGTFVELHVNGEGRHWDELSVQILEEVRKALGEDFYGSIVIRRAVPRVQEGVKGILVFATQNVGCTYDVVIQLVGDSVQETLH